MIIPDLTCKELVEIITDYLEDTLSENERRRFEEHLTTCDGCRRYLDQMRKTIQLAGRLSERDLTPPAKTKLLSAFRTWKAGMD